MKFRELTEEQMDKICDYIEENYATHNEKGFITNFGKWCQKCPFSYYIGEFDYYDCARPALDRELPQEFIDIIKKD